MTIEDLAWAAEHEMINMTKAFKGLEDEVLNSLLLIGRAMGTFEAIQGNVILDRVLHGTIRDAL